MTDAERPDEPDTSGDEFPDGPLTPEEAEDDPSVNPDDPELERVKGG